MKTPNFTRLLAAASALLVASNFAQAETAYWSTSCSTATLWSATTNWNLSSDGSGANPTVVPGAGDLAYFNTTGNDHNSTVTLNGALSIEGLRFTTTGSTTIYGNTNALRIITIGASGIDIQAGAGNVSFGNGSNRPTSLVLGASQTWNNNSGNLNLNYSTTTPTSLSLGAFTLTIDGTGNVNVNDPVSGSGSDAIIKNGSGKLTLSGNNTYTGTTTIGAGILQADAADVASTSGALGNGGNITFTGGALQYTSLSAATDYSTRFKNSTSAITLDTNGQSVALAGIMDSSNNGGLTKQGSGTLTLSNSNAYTGTTWIQNGTISVASINTNLGGTGAIKLGENATTGALVFTGTSNEAITRNFDLAGTTGGGVITNNSATNNTLTINGTISSSGAGSKLLTLNGTATGTNTVNAVISDNGGANVTSVAIGGSGVYALNGSNTYSGGTTVTGEVRAGNNNAYGTGTVTFSGAGTWGGSGSRTIANNIVYADATSANNLGSNNVTDFTGQMSGPGNLSVNGFSGSTVRFSGDNSGWTGNWKFNGPIVLQLNNIHAMGAGTTITFNSGAAAGRGTLESQVALTGANAITQNIVLGTDAVAGNATIKTTADMQVTGNMSGTVDATFVKDGAAKLILTGTNTYLGTTTISAGTLQIGDGGTTGSLSTSSAITNNAALAFNRSNTVTQGVDFATVISGTGNVVQDGTGNLILATGNTYSGNTTVNGGGTGSITIGDDSALGTAPGAATAASLVLNNGGLVTTGTMVLNSNRGILLSGPGGEVNVNAGTTTYGGIIAGTGFRKSGTGILLLTGANTYTGATQVSAGKLVINGDNSAATGAMTVDNGASLGGNGTIGGATTIDGTHTPGNSPGLQTFVSDLTYGGNATFVFELISNATATRGTDFDGVDVGGALSITSGAAFNITLNGAGSTTDFTNVFWASNQTWLVFSGATGGSGNFVLGTVSLDSLGQNYSAYGSFNTSRVGNDIQLNWVAVPEPAAWLLAAFGLTTAVVFRRRRRD